MTFNEGIEMQRAMRNVRMRQRLLLWHGFLIFR